MPRRSLADAVANRLRTQTTVPSAIPMRYIATWEGAESIDANLSSLFVPGGSRVRFVPKLTSVTGLVAGNPVLIEAGPNGGFIIVGKITGNAALADATLALPDHIPPTVPGTPVTSAPTTSTLTVTWTGSTDASGIAGYDLYYSTGQLIGSTTALSAVIGGLSPSTLYGFVVRARDIYNNVSGFSAQGNGTTAAIPAPNPTNPILYTLSYPAIWSGTYNYNSHNEYDSWYGTQCNQGHSSGGNTKSMMGFNSAQIVANAAGFISPVNAWITLTYSHWWYNAGGTAVIGTNAEASRPGGFTGSSDRLRSGSWPRGARRQVSLGSGICNEFLGGATRGINLGPGPTSDNLYYGTAYGAGSGSNQPILTVQFWR